MRGHIVAGVVVLLICTNFWTLCALLQPPAASDRMCVPLYDQTGLECCQ